MKITHTYLTTLLLTGAAALAAEPQPKPGESNYWTIERYLRERPIVNEAQIVGTDGRGIIRRIWVRTDQTRFIYGESYLVDNDRGTNLGPMSFFFSEDGKTAFQFQTLQNGLITRREDDFKICRTIALGSLCLMPTVIMAPNGISAECLAYRNPEVATETDQDGRWTVVHVFPNEPRYREYNLEIRIT